MSIVFKGTGSYLPEVVVDESSFMDSEFYGPDNQKITNPNDVIIRKFRSITGIKERRYARKDQITSEIATIAAKNAIEDAGIDPETLDGILMAHNYGDIPYGSHQSDAVPSLACRVKHNLGIKNPACVAFDILFGCPGWVQAVITARNYILAGEGKRYLTVGSDMLSRVIDPYDRDKMIFADGAGAVIVEKDDNAVDSGILSVANLAFTKEEVYYISAGYSLNPEFKPGTSFIRMQGRKVYEFALTNVPAAIKACLDKSGKDIKDVKKIFIHQANAKMDEAILKRFYALYDIEDMPVDVMPMTIDKLGNSSIATIPTLIDLVRKGQLEGHELHKGDIIILASVGAGMAINAITYQV